MGQKILTGIAPSNRFIGCGMFTVGLYFLLFISTFNSRLTDNNFSPNNFLLENITNNMNAFDQYTDQLTEFCPTVVPTCGPSSCGQRYNDKFGAAFWDYDLGAQFSKSWWKARSFIENRINKKLDQTAPHMSFFYVCCMNLTQLLAIDNIIDNEFEWKPHNISFNKVECSFDPNDKDDGVYIHISVSNQSQQLMDEWIHEFEDFAMKSDQFGKKWPKFKMYHRGELFHSTLAWFDYTKYNVIKLVTALNKHVVHENEWTQHQVTVRKPCYTRWEDQGFHCID